MYAPTDTSLGFSFTLHSHMSSHFLASNTSYLQDSCLISSRQDTTPGALRLQFLLLNATQDFLLLLKLDYYQFPSPPNRLTYIPEVRPFFFFFNFICSVTLGLFTSSVFQILYLWHQRPKWSFIASRQEPQRNSSPKWCDKPEKYMLTYWNIHIYLYVCKH